MRFFKPKLLYIIRPGRFEFLNIEKCMETMRSTVFEVGVKKRGSG